MNKTLTIKYSSIRTFFFIFLIVKPQILTSMHSAIPYVFAGLQGIILLVIIAKNRIKKDKILLCSLAFFIYQFFNNVIQGGTWGYLLTIISGLYTVCIIQYLVEVLGNDKFFSLFSKSFVILLTINLLFSAFGIALNSEYHDRSVVIMFLGRYNQLTCYLILAVITLFYNYSCCGCSKLSLISSIVLIFLNILYVRSATLVICIVIILISFIIGKFPKIIVKHITPFSATIVLIITFYVLTVSFNYEFMNPIFEKLGKDSTLSQRTAIWEMAYNELAHVKPMLFGFGEISGGAYITIWTGNTFSAHNLFLQLMLDGGIILLGIYLVMCFFTGKRISMISDQNVKATTIMLLFAYFIACMTEVFPINLNIAVLYITYLFSKRKKEQFINEI